MADDRTELGAFLRARRNGMTPARAGMDAFPGHRRVPGLRKEELAYLAGVSSDYYSRLEQGRQAHISTAVLDALARALRLDEIEHAHLRDLANPTTEARPFAERPQRPDPGLLRLMTTLDHVPVILLGQRAEVLAVNSLLSKVLGDIPVGLSLVRYLFLDPAAQQRIVNWGHFAAASVAALRRESARHPLDSGLTTLVAELRAASPEAERWWSDHSVRDYASVSKIIDHPVTGELRFDIEIVSAPHQPDQRLIVYTVQVGSPTEAALPLIASWGDLPRASDSLRTDAGSLEN